jgi:high-affinity K+ transport system ATPase subunit B
MKISLSELGASLFGGTRANQSQTLVTVKSGELIPCAGTIVAGTALVDESAMTGVSTPALLSPEKGHNEVMAETLVVDGEITIRPHPEDNQ